MATARRAAGEAAAQASGMRTILILAVLTIVEYLAAVGLQSVLTLVLVLTLLALIKGWLIVMAFMHFARVWRGEPGEGGHA